LAEIQGKIILTLEGLLLVSGIYGLIEGLNIASNQWGRRKMFFEVVAVIGLYSGTTIELYSDVKVFWFLLYPINAILFGAITLAVMSIWGYISRWTKKS
jgi:phosphatidylglycerophosphate synthase